MKTGLFDADDCRLTSAVKVYIHLDDQVNAIGKLLPHPGNFSSSSGVDIFEGYANGRQWALQTLRNCLETAPAGKFGYDDGPAMVTLARYFESPGDFFTNTYVPPSSVAGHFNMTSNPSVVFYPKPKKESPFLHSTSAFCQGYGNAASNKTAYWQTAGKFIAQTQRSLSLRSIFRIYNVKK